MKPTHLLVDLENVKAEPDGVRAFLADTGSAWIFHSPHQKKLLQKLQAIGDRVTLVPTSRPGKNSLDFHLVFYLGYLASRNNHCRFVVLSKDKDYDPAIEHACLLGLDVTRRKALAADGEPAPTRKMATAKKSAPTAKKKLKKRAAKKKTKASSSPGFGELVARVISDLREHPKNRPNKKKALESHLATLLRGKILAGELPVVVAELERLGVVKFTEKKIEYKFPSVKD